MVSRSDRTGARQEEYNAQDPRGGHGHVRLLRSAMPLITRKNSGMKKIPIVVANSMPANTVVPIACRLAAPAPLAITSGKTPKMNAKDVIRIGRNRIRADSM